MSGCDRIIMEIRLISQYSLGAETDTELLSIICFGYPGLSHLFWSALTTNVSSNAITEPSLTTGDNVQMIASAKCLSTWSEIFSDPVTTTESKTESAGGIKVFY